MKEPSVTADLKRIAIETRLDQAVEAVGILTGTSGVRL